MAFLALYSSVLSSAVEMIRGCTVGTIVHFFMSISKGKKPDNVLPIPFVHTSFKNHNCILSTFSSNYKMSGEKSNLKVIIVGGSVAGLTLAHSLRQVGIDYVVLEAYKEIAPQVGASIGILPNGARVLDQLGCFDDINSLCDPLRTVELCTGEGEFMSKSDSSQLTQAR